MKLVHTTVFMALVVISANRPVFSQRGPQDSHRRERVSIVELLTPDGIASEAIGVNERGLVAGWSDTTEQASMLTVWHKGTAVVDTAPGGFPSYPVAVNNRGQVLGFVSGGDRAFLWDKGVYTDLGTLGGRYLDPPAVLWSAQRSRAGGCGYYTPERRMAGRTMGKRNTNRLGHLAGRDVQHGGGHQ